MGLWWTHLANASVAVFHGSLEQFSAWAASPAGLECLVAWLKRMPELGEDTPLEMRTLDFAGQKTYYATNQLFYTKQAVYLIVWSVTDKASIEEKVLSWLMANAACKNAGWCLVATWHVTQAVTL